MIRILGIDPGSRSTGYGLIDAATKGPALVACGCIRTDSETFPYRLKQIYDGIVDIVRLYQPDELAIEPWAMAAITAGAWWIIPGPAAVSQTRALYVCVRQDGSTTPVLAYVPPHRGDVQCVRWNVSGVP